MSDSYERGYRAGYKQAKKEIDDSQCYKKGFKDALEYIKGLLSVQIARGNINEYKSEVEKDGQ